MGSIRRILFFGLVAAPLWGVLVWPWPGLGRAYASVFRPVAEFACAFVFGGHEIDLVPDVVPQENIDTALIMRRDGHPGLNRVGFDSWSTGYLPFATFIALFVALVLTTRSLPRRRKRAFVKGVILIHLYIGVHLLVIALKCQASYAANAPAAFPAFISSDWWRSLVNSGMRLLHENHVTYSLTPVVLWGLACFEGRDLGLLHGGAEEAGEGAAQAD